MDHSFIYALFMPIAIIGFFACIGGNFLLLLRDKSTLTMLSIPILGGLISGFIAYVSLLSRCTLQQAIIIQIIIAISGAICWLYVKENRHILLNTLQIKYISIAVLLLLATCTPFLWHSVPPDVDAQYTGTTAAHILMGDTYPNLRLWGPNSAPIKSILPDSNAIQAALLSFWSPHQLAQTLIALANSWTLATLLLAAGLVMKISPTLPLQVQLATLFAFGMSRSFIWNYGDGSYTRLPGIAALLLAVTATILLIKDKKHRDFAIVTATLVGTLAYFHQRYEIILCHYLLIFATLYFMIAKGQSKFTIFKLFLITGIASSIFLIPLLTQLSTYLELANSGTNIGNPETERSFIDVFNNTFWRFQGPTIWVLVIIGIGVGWHAKQGRTPIFLAALALFITFIAFTVPDIMRTLNPNVMALAYPRVTAMSAMVAVKVVFGTLLLYWLYQHLLKYIAKQQCSYYFLTALFLLLIVNFGLAYFDFNNLGRFQASLFNPPPITFFWHYWYGYLVLATATTITITSVTRYIKFKKQAKLTTSLLNTNLLTSLLTVLALSVWFNELREARFNYPYQSKALIETAKWFKENTKKQQVLVYAPCNINPFGTNKDKAAQVQTSKFRYDWSLSWIPVLALRPTVCNRMHLVAEKSNVFGKQYQKPENWNQLRQAYWKLNEKESIDILIKAGVTHLVTTANTELVYGKKFISEEHRLQLAFKTKMKHGNAPISIWHIVK